MDCLNCEDEPEEIGGLCPSCYRAMFDEVYFEDSVEDRTVEDTSRANGCRE
jgi:hypothetical protein